jgi:hypothetical protein
LKINFIIILSFIFLGSNLGIANARSKNSFPIWGNSLTTKSTFGVKDYNLVINKSALNKELLLTTALISGPPAATGTAYLNKIVYFERRMNKLYMFETIKHKMVTESVSTKILLAEYPIVNVNQNSIEFDYKAGTKNIVLSYEPWEPEAKKRPAPNDTVAEVTNLFVDEVSLKGKYLHINQFAQVIAEGKTSTIQIKNSFSEYSPNPNFKAKRSSKMHKVGYFENPEIINTEADKVKDFKVTHIMKFDHQKEIKFYLSNNIPQQNIEAVKRGVLYWNKAFGKEVLKVETLPKGVTIHDPGHNIVQWMDWDTAGFAYADMQTDPRTGETLQAHVYMTSVFGVSSYKLAKKIFKRMIAEQNKEISHENHGHFTLKNFKSSKLCEYRFHENMKTDFINLFERLEQVDEAEAQVIFQRFSNDYITEVVAHEIGHTLGLRHNFAGSLHTNINPQNYTAATQDYFFSGDVPVETIVTSSTMEYTPSMLAAMVGAKIRLGQMAQTYDLRAITWGYTDQDLEDVGDSTPFCSDELAGKYVDCVRFDRFKNITQSALYDYQNHAKNYAWQLVDKFSFLDPENENAVDADKRERAIKMTVLDPISAATSFIGNLDLVLKSINMDANYISQRLNYPKTMGLIEKNLYKDDIKNLQFTSMKNGTLIKEQIFNLLELDTNKKVIPFINNLKELTSRFVAKYYNLTQVEEELIEKKLNTFYPVLEREILFKVTESLKKFKSSMFKTELASAITNLTSDILNQKSTQVIGEVETKSIYKPLYEYINEKSDLRKNALELVKVNLLPGTSSYLFEMKKHAKSLFETHEASQKEMAKDTAAEESLSETLYDWFQKEKDRFKTLATFKKK